MFASDISKKRLLLVVLFVLSGLPILSAQTAEQKQDDPLAWRSDGSGGTYHVMPMMMLPDLREHLVQLKAAQEQYRQQVQFMEGAIQECQFWIDRLTEKAKVSEEGKPESKPADSSPTTK